MRIVAAASAFGVLLLASAGAAAAGGRDAARAGEERRIDVVVSIVPQATFVERIGGEHVRAEVLVKPGQSPHVFEPTPRQMAALSDARAYFSIGLPFEAALLGKIRGLNREIEIIDTGRGIERRHLEGEQELVGHAGLAETPDGTDPHIWLSPRLVKIQARNICDGLASIDPARADTYRANLSSFLTDLDTLDAELTAAFAAVRGQSFFVFHPAFGYFADAYGLRQVPIEVAGKEPGPRELAAIVERARSEGVRIIFVEPQFSDKTARAVAREIGGAVVSVDPLARDYLANLRRIADEVQKGLRP
jgi:zinc transport system substrate-binding protein